MSRFQRREATDMEANNQIAFGHMTMDPINYGLFLYGINKKIETHRHVCPIADVTSFNYI